MSLDTLKINDFDAIKLRLAAPEDIRLWSHGEVTRPETINYRTQKPEKDGLFCERTFGPSKDWECYCGKYKKIRYRGIVCDKCGVEVTRSIVRRQRMGHIDLAVPVSHIWFLRGVPSKIGLILDVSIQKLERVIYFANFIVTEVNEELKVIEIENLKKEYKGQKKTLEIQFEQKIKQIESNSGLEKADRNDQIVKANQWRDEEVALLDEDFEMADKDLKDLKPLKIISEVEYHDMSLKYGHVFDAGIGAEAVRKLLEKVDLATEIKKIEEELKDDNSAKQKKLINRSKLLKSLSRNNIKPEHMVLKAVPVIPPDLRPMVPLDGGRFATSDLNDLYRRVISRNNRLRRLLDLNAPEVICRNEKRMLQEAVDALIDNSARHSKTTTASTGQKRKLKSIADYLKGKRGRFRQNLLGKRVDYSGRSVIVIGPELKLGQCGLPKKMALELFKPFIISQLIKREYVHNIRSANRFIEADRPEVWDILEETVREAHVLLNRAPTLHRLGIQAFQPILVEGRAIQLHPLVCSAFNADFDGDQMAVHVPLTEQAKAEARDLMLSTKNLLKPATGNPVVTPSMDMVWGGYYVTSINTEKADQKPKAFSSAQEAKIAYDLRKMTLREPMLVRVSKKEFGSKVKKDELFNTTLGRILFNDLLPDKLPYYNEVVDKKKMGEITKLCLEYYGFQETADMLDRIKSFGFKQLTKSGFSWGLGDLPDVIGKKELIDKGNKEIEEINEQYEEGLLTGDERYTKVIEVWTHIKDEVTKLSQNILPPEGPVYSMINSGARGSWGQLTQMLGMKGLVTNPSGRIFELPVKANFKEGFSVLEYYISTHGTRKGLSDTALRTANAGYLTRRLVDVAQDLVILEEDCGDTEGRIMTKEESESMGQKLIDRVVGRYVISDVLHPKTGKVVLKAGEIITDDIARDLAKLDLLAMHIRSALSCKMSTGICKKCYGYDLAYNKPVELGTAVGIIAAQSIGEPGTQLTMRTFHTGGVAGSDITQGLPRVEEIFEARPPKKKALIAEVAGLVAIQEQQKTIKGPKGEILAQTSFGERVLKIAYNDSGEEEVYTLKDSFKLKVKENDLVGEKETLFVDEDKNKVKARRNGRIVLADGKLKIVSDVEAVKEYIIPAGVVLWVRDGDMVEKGAQLTEGSLDLAQYYKIAGREAVQDYILKEIQYIYSSQGQKLNDKHVELIARQMFSRVYVQNPGDTFLLEGEVVERAAFSEANQLLVEGAKPAEGDEVFLGISKVSLSTQSFLSAASFQETARVLINSAVTGRIDHLRGLKENVIIGRLIPAGTGFRAVPVEEEEETEGEGIVPPEAEVVVDENAAVTPAEETISE
ncbi:MAG: DNA-directed RNA polymerase subunit beta' [Parcubacteria group bacterium GW2011_GWC2_39_14]|nr:MAG: DNA-directed RNA polymerase subunit beta' [Parcubacteria group bacterium GW2011_GWC2_39_14]KKR53809.1 MAG: DNA-directed RNA polymerase subunit beta' [Parcubacteria group bacterium GW2011_GWA2_40_23]